MKNASTLLKRYIKTGGAFYAYAVVTLATGEKLTLTSDNDFMISPNSYTEQGGSDGFPLGAAVSKTITLTIDNIDERYSKYDFYYARIALYTEADIDYQTLRDINNDVVKDIENDPILTIEPHIERMQEGVFTVLEPVAIGDVIELTAYDDMWKSDRTFTTQLTYPTTALQLLQEVCTSCGMVLGSPTFRNSDFSISSVPEKTTGRKIIGYIAQLACGNAVIQNGMLTIKTHDFSAFSGITDSTKPESLQEDSGYHIFEDFSSDPDIDTDNVVITGISTEVESETGGDAETVISGTDDYCIKITNPLIKGKEQTVVNSIAEILVGVTLRKFSGDFFPNPTVEFMDLACVVDRKDKVYRTIVTTHEFEYLGGSKFSCDINSPSRQAGEYYSEAAGIYNGIKKDVANNKKNVANMQNAIELLNTTLENAAGMYESNVKQSDGSVVSFIHDKPTLAESKVVIKVTAEAIGLSNDGGKTYPYGIILTGDLIARILYTVGINADYINSGTITGDRISGGMITGTIYRSSGVNEGDGTKRYLTLDSAGIEFGSSQYNESEPKYKLSRIKCGGEVTGDTTLYVDQYFDSSSYGGSDGKISFRMLDKATGKNYTAMSLSRERLNSKLNILSMKGRIYVKDGGLDSDKSQIKGGVLWEDNDGRSKYGIGPHQSTSYSSGNHCDATQVWGALYCESLLVSGYKKRIVETDNYGTRSMYCYEMASPIFGDIGEAKLDESGKCAISIDDIFSSVSDTNLQYQVFLQKEGEGDLWVAEKHPEYFLICGTPNLSFSWEIKCRQTDFKDIRMEEDITYLERDNIDYEEEGNRVLMDYLAIQEEI